MRVEYIEGLGEVSFTKRKISTRITVKIEPNDKIKVSIPQGLSYRVAKNYLFENIHIIQQKVQKLNKQVTRFDNLTNFKTKWHKLNLIPNEVDHIEYKIIDYSINVHYPHNLDIYDKYLQEIIRKAIIEALRIEAKEYLPNRLLTIANQHHLHYNKVFIKNIKTQWGSCSYKNNINLNLHIMRLPNHLIDYILIHELCHTIHKNHSAEFWKMLSKIYTSDLTKARQELKNYTPQLYSF
jgi:predicted metal-dependent hydrolase